MSSWTIPLVDYRFGDRYYITEFVRPDTYLVVDAAERLGAADPATKVLNVARWIRDNFYYPLTATGQPSADGQLLKSSKGFAAYHFKKCVPYMWLFPGECIYMRFGICIDTSLVATSVLIRMAIDAVTALGAVYDRTGQLLGYHAWTEFVLNGTRYVLETTIHEPNVNNIMLADDAYKGTFGVRYDKYAEFNHERYTEYKPILSFLLFFRRSKKDIRRDLLKLQRYLWTTYREISPLLAGVLK